MTISAMSHYGLPQHPPLSPAMYPQGSAVDFLGAMAQQYQSQQLINQHIQHQYEKQLLMHRMRQQMMMMSIPQTPDSEGYLYSIQHQQMEFQRQLQQGFLSPLHNQAAHAATLISTPMPPLSHDHLQPEPQPSKCATTEIPKRVSPVVNKPRTNFHSIADLVGDSYKHEEKPNTEESSTEFIHRGNSDTETADTSTGSDSENLIIDVVGQDLSPAAERTDQTTCSQPIKELETPPRDQQPITVDKHSTNEQPIMVEKAPVAQLSPRNESRATSPALSTASSIRDTDTPGSVASTDSFTSINKEDEKKTKKAPSEEDSTKRTNKSRRIFQAPQIHILEQVFTQCQYPEPAFVEKLARDLDTTDGKVRVWFQNKRARWRKRSQENDQTKQSPWLPGTPLYPLSPLQSQQMALAMSGIAPAGYPLIHPHMPAQFPHLGQP